MCLFYSFSQHTFIECLPEVLVPVDGAVNETEPKPALVECGFLLGRWRRLLCFWSPWFAAHSPTLATSAGAPGSFPSQDQVWVLSRLVSPISRSDRLKLVMLKACSANSHGFQRPFQRGMWAHMCSCNNREVFVFFSLRHECAMELSKIYKICGIKTDWREKQRDDKLSAMKPAITETCKLRKQCHFMPLNFFWGKYSFHKTPNLC